MGVGATTEAFIVYQPEKVSIPLRRGEISRLHRLSSRYLNRRRRNEGRT